MKKKHKILISLLLLFLLVGAYLLILDEKGKRIGCFNENCFELEVAETENEKRKGLQNREELDKDSGMLFVFEKEDRHFFWMKDTLIPLDIIWLDKDKRVVSIKRNVQPCKGNCPSFCSEEKTKYVVELNANTVDKINLEKGDKLFLK